MSTSHRGSLLFSSSRRKQGWKQALPYAEITNPQSINKYHYVYNNPLRYIDPDGHQGDEKKSLVDQLLELVGGIWKGKTREDGMLPGSGDGEARKQENNGPLGVCKSLGL